MPGPLVDTGSVVERECDVANAAGEGFTDGDGDGEGETVGDGEGVTKTGCSGVGATTFGVCIAAEVLLL